MPGIGTCWVKALRAGVGMVLIAMLMGAGGCKSGEEDEAENLAAMFVLAEEGAEGEAYGEARLESDLRRLLALRGALEEVDVEITEFVLRANYGGEAYLSAEDNARAEYLMMRYVQGREGLLDILEYYRVATPEEAGLQARGMVTGMAAGVLARSYSSRFVAVLHGEERIVELINEAHPRIGVEAGSYDRLKKEVTSIDAMAEGNAAWHLFSAEVADETSELGRLRAEEGVYAELIKAMYQSVADTRLQTEYVLLATKSSLPKWRNRLRHSRTAALAGKLKAGVGETAYAGRGFLFTHVARIKDPVAEPVTFEAGQLAAMKAVLEPGDFILTFSEGYMSNVFLPGVFKHGITYIGRVEERRAAGLTDAELEARAFTEGQRDELLRRVRVRELDGGGEADVIEAVAEGVIFNSLEKLLDEKVNRVAVLRPRMSARERTEQLVTLFQYLGTAYDFRFDFADNNFQCCTELIYRCTLGKGAIGFELERLNGRWVLTADQILEYALEHPEALEVVLLADGDPAGDGTARIRMGEAGEVGLRGLVGVE